MHINALKIMMNKIPYPKNDKRFINSKNDKKIQLNIEKCSDSNLCIAGSVLFLQR